MRSVLLAVIVALCAVLTPAVSTASIGAPPPKSKTSAPKEEAPREERETSRLRLLVSSVDRSSKVAAPTFITVFTPRAVPGVLILVSNAEPIVVWRTPPALQVFRN